MSRCPRCALPLQGPAAHELWQVDQALAGLRDQQARLQARRTELLGILRAGAADQGAAGAGVAGAGSAGVAGAGAAGMAGVGSAGAAGAGPAGVVPPYAGVVPPYPGVAAGPGGGGLGVPGREVSPGAAKNVLLILGGLLLTVAAVVFTVVSWGQMSMAGRAAVLVAFTALVMLAPVVLIRRRLTATAETVAGLAVVLLLLDGYAARRVGLLGVDALDALQYTAGVFGLTALILVAYARVTRLRGPAPVAVVLAQPVLPLLTGDLPETWLMAMLVVTAALDVPLVRYGRGAVRVTAAVTGSGVAALALLVGAPDALGASSVGQALVRSVPLVALALLGGFVTWLLVRSGKAQAHRETWAAVVTAGTALTLIAVPAALVLPVLDGPGTGWRPLAYLVPALVVVLVAAWLPWRRVRVAGMVTGGVVALLTTLVVLPRVVATLVAPLAWLDVLWTGTWNGRQWPPFEMATPVDVAVVGTLAAGLLAVAVQGTGGWRAPKKGAASGESVSRASVSGALGSDAPGSGVPGPDAPGSRAPGSGVSGSGVLVFRVLVVGALVAGALMVAVVPQAFAMPYPAAVAVQAVLAVALALAATLGRVPWWAVACALVAAPAALRAAAYAFGSEPATLIVLPILAVAAAAMALAARVKELRVWGLGFAALFLGLEAVAVGFSLGLRVLVAASVGFAVAGVLVLLMSLWAGSAGGLRYAGTTLLLLASWLRLGADEVTVVEAYTVPCSLVLLGSGWLRRRRAPVSSWAAYGAGLSFTMLPSLVVVYSDTEWRRSLALGVLALAVLFAGARFRLQAPTVIGGVVLAGVVVRELAPYVSELFLVVPRWVPIAVGGVLLVVVGATYEARIRDLRRVRDALRAMG
ncbi:SCO7613 C-terminal domain-containing membrane protein [Nonomuraea jabiensis]|uniref:SCO7613 C-terminal domain-containing membrane protein n=1 Tax=Nonomuraea jabiensis TaxID=882448 RepID=UPI003D75A6CF